MADASTATASVHVLVALVLRGREQHLVRNKVYCQRDTERHGQANRFAYGLIGRRKDGQRDDMCGQCDRLMGGCTDRQLLMDGKADRETDSLIDRPTD